MTKLFTLSACAEMLWRGKPMQWRLRRLTELGFEAGIWNWRTTLACWNVPERRFLQ